MAIKKRKKLRYIFVNGDLCKVLHINRADDIVTVWNYTVGKRVGYAWSSVQRYKQNGYTAHEVCEMLNRSYPSLFRDLNSEGFPKPQQIYTLDEHKKPGKYIYSETDLMNLRDYLASIPRGRPRHDGLITPARKIPSRAELEAKIKNEDAVLYVKDQHNNYVPVYREMLG